MIERTYQWNRYWYPRGSQINLLNGFLHFPKRIERFFLSGQQKQKLFLFESIAEVPCLILLGEPGMGKSQALKEAYQSVESKIEGSNDDVHLINLAHYSSESYLAEELFKDQFFIDWLSGTHRLHLFLDSLDEARLRIETVTNLLIRNLKKHHSSLNRLYLRLACRTSDWPTDFETKLRQLWNNDSVEAYVLAPLQQQDVVQAAQDYDIDTDAFWRDLAKKEVGPFAARPVTLKFLLPLYRQKQQLPDTQYQLYLKGCQELCRETNKSHDTRDDLQPEQRFVIAARIAACTIFTNHYRIHTERTWYDDSDKEYVTVQELARRNESVGEVPFPIYEANIKETLQTALFSGASLRQWAHQTFAEFLAAWYAHKNMTFTQIKSLIFHPDGQLIPQLHETAAWLASFREDIFGEIIKSDPHVLLQSDMATKTAQAKAKLTAALLKQYQEGIILDYQYYSWLEKLKHPNLAKQLKPYLENTSNDLEVRKLAIHIATTCKQSSLEDLLVKISLDSQESLDIREWAAHTVINIGSEEAKAQLKPLALLPLEKQTRNLKRHGIEAVWPDHLTGAELFPTFSASDQDYDVFGFNLPNLIVQHLTLSDLPIALAWVERQPRHYHSASRYRSYLMNLIMRRAWLCLESAQIIESFTKAALSRLLNYDAIVEDEGDRNSWVRLSRAKFISETHQTEATRDKLFSQMIRDDHEKRRKILKAAILVLLKPFRNEVPIPSNFVMRITSALTHRDTPLVTSQDIEWLVQQLLTTDCKKKQTIFVRLLWRVFNAKDEEQFTFLYEACQSHPNLQDALGRPFEAIPLDSEYAQKEREFEAQRQKREQEWKEREEKEERLNDPPLKPSPIERVMGYLEECELGKHQSWWRLSYYMAFLKNGRFLPDYQEEPDLTILPVWQELDDEIRARIIEAAKNYILTCEPSEYEWLGSDKIYYPVIAGYRAFRLLPNFIFALPSEVWQRWAAVILYYLHRRSSLFRESNEDGQTEIVLLALAYQHAPDQIIEALIRLIDMENEQGDVYVINKIEKLWDERLKQAIVEKVQDSRLKPASMGVLLDKLLIHHCQAAKLFAESLISVPVSDDKESRERTKVAACSLMRYSSDLDWSIIWPIFQQDHELSRELIEMIAIPIRYHRCLEQKLSETQLSEFYIWLAQQFPHAEDPKREGGYIATERHHYTNLRDSMIGYLSKFGSKLACEELRRINCLFPDVDLSWSIRQAEELYRRNTWNPPQAAQVIELAKNQQTHWVRGGNQLLDIIIELLDKLNEELQGKNGSTPAAIDLWNEEGKKKKPKDENRLSDYVERYLKRELEGRGIFIGREVQTRRGSFTDIYVETFVKRANGDLDERLTIIIEVKGCWHKELQTAMSTQLVNRYLEDSAYQYGLYLVGWYLCDKWDDGDYKKKHQTFEKVKTQLTDQAQELSKNGLDVRAFLLDARLS